MFVAECIGTSWRGVILAVLVCLVGGSARADERGQLVSQGDLALEELRYEEAYELFEKAERLGTGSLAETQLLYQRLAEILVHVLHLSGTRVAAAAASWNTFVCFAPIVALAWLRRGEREPRALGATLAASFALLYGTTSYWAFQYLAWSLPFWFFLPARIAAPVTLLLAAYVYGVYANYTGSPLLLGRWDFVRHAPWPPLLVGLRDASVLACFAVGWGSLARAALRARLGAST
jgi:hypothetical protein